MTVLSICTAYESGFGRGLSGREMSQPYADGCGEAEAYVLGYQRAAAKVRGKTFTVETTCVEKEKSGG